MDSKTIISTTDKYYLPVFGRYQVAFTHGKGCYLYDAEGKAYLDFLGGIAVNAVGYAHPAVVSAVAEQAGRLMHCSNLYYTDIQAKVVELLSRVTGFDRIFLANSGAEANEGALKLAKKYGVSKNSEKYRVISADHSFHGRTFATLAATGHDYYRVGYGPLPPGHSFVPYGDSEALEQAMNDKVCAVLVEPIQGEGGVHVPPVGYLAKVRELCDKYDALLIYDEVQTGVCRTGKWFAYELSGVKPDVLTFAKAVGGGFPMGGFAVDEKLAHVFAPGDHGSTFGGNALSCAAAYATLTTLLEMEAPQHVTEVGAYFREKLEALAAKYPTKVKEVRGAGLILGMELTASGKPVAESCLAEGVIINCTAGNVLRFVPPLIVTEQEIDIVIGALDRALAQFTV